MAKDFVTWDWRTVQRVFVTGQYPLEVLPVMGFSEDATGCLEYSGAVFGIVVQGIATIVRDGMSSDLDQGMWFAFDRGLAKVKTTALTKILLINALGKSVQFQIGGPLEDAGRLRYIDGCTDSILVHPWKLGEPCLNHLHFPPGISQTSHTHPSDRVGVVVRGTGWCETPDGSVRLDPGSLFRIPANGVHRFLTEHLSMSVVAFHPDSDVGPTDDDHPIINRTIVGGVSAKFLDNIRTRNV